MPQLDIQTDLIVGDSHYKVEADLPAEKVTAAKPYKFLINEEQRDLVAFAVGGKDKENEENVFLKLSPPASLFPVDSLIPLSAFTVIFSSGSYKTSDPFNPTKPTTE